MNIQSSVVFIRHKGDKDQQRDFYSTKSSPEPSAFVTSLLLSWGPSLVLQHDIFGRGSPRPRPERPWIGWIGSAPVKMSGSLGGVYVWVAYLYIDCESQ